MCSFITQNLVERVFHNKLETHHPFVRGYDHHALVEDAVSIWKQLQQTPSGRFPFASGGRHRECFGEVGRKLDRAQDFIGNFPPAAS